MPKELMPCPSLGARDRHRRAGEPVCDECQKFWLAYLKERREDPDAAKRKACTECGRGINKKEFDLCSRCRKRGAGKVCLECQQPMVSTTRDLCYRCKSDPGKRPACGTVGGYVWHTRVLHESPCTSCRKARNLRRSGPVPDCINPGCKSRVYKKDQEYCASCRQGSIIGWMTHKGIQKPIYYRKGVNHEQKVS